MQRHRGEIQESLSQRDKYTKKAAQRVWSLFCSTYRIQVTPANLGKLQRPPSMKREGAAAQTKREDDEFHL